MSFKRKPGTGTIRYSKGRWEVLGPQSYDGDRLHQPRLGHFDTYDEGDAFLAEYLSIDRQPQPDGTPSPSTAAKGRPRGSTNSAEAVAATVLTKQINAFLDDVRAQRLAGKRSAMVNLGKLKGFPQATDDPDVVDKAAAEYERRAAAAPTAVRELEARQRVLDLKAAAARLREVDEVDESREAFMNHGAQWAVDRGISYAAFRDLGIPAAVLREAGITR